MLQNKITLTLGFAPALFKDKVMPVLSSIYSFVYARFFPSKFWFGLPQMYTLVLHASTKTSPYASVRA